jgi:hypothetical protein
LTTSRTERSHRPRRRPPTNLVALVDAPSNEFDRVIVPAVVDCVIRMNPIDGADELRGASTTSNARLVPHVGLRRAATGSATDDLDRRRQGSALDRAPSFS